VHVNVTAGSSLECYVPDLLLPSSTAGSWMLEFKLVDPSNPYSMTGDVLTALYWQRPTNALTPI
jgi:hypothetical protein